jgi:hypothetical protein
VTSTPVIDYKSNEWYTPVELIEMVRSFYGGSIPLDAASCADAQKIVKADHCFSIENSAFDNDWFGKVWLNPEYSYPAVKRFCDRAVEQYRNGNCDEVLILVNNATDTEWFYALSKYPVLFSRGRIKFWKPCGEYVSPRLGQALFYLGTRYLPFYKTFEGEQFYRCS